MLMFNPVNLMFNPMKMMFNSANYVNPVLSQLPIHDPTKLAYSSSEGRDIART